MNNSCANIMLASGAYLAHIKSGGDSFAVLSQIVYWLSFVDIWDNLIS